MGNDTELASRNINEAKNVLLGIYEEDKNDLDSNLPETITVEFSNP